MGGADTKQTPLELRSERDMETPVGQTDFLGRASLENSDLRALTAPTTISTQKHTCRKKTTIFVRNPFLRVARKKATSRNLPVVCIHTRKGQEGGEHTMTGINRHWGRQLDATN